MGFIRAFFIFYLFIEYNPLFLSNHLSTLIWFEHLVTQ